MQRNHGPKTSTLTSLRQGTTDSNAVESYYDDWADKYDETLAEWQYRAPEDASDLLASALRKRGYYTVDGIDISAASLHLAERLGDYARLIHHDLQDLPLPVQDNAYDAAASVGVFTYIEDAEALLRDLCRCVRPGGANTFTQRTDLWQERNFPEMIARLERDDLWANHHISPPQRYLPGNEEFSDEINVIHTLSIVT